jgi:hypothetical protein
MLATNDSTHATIVDQDSENIRAISAMLDVSKIIHIVLKFWL